MSVVQSLYIEQQYFVGKRVVFPLALILVNHLNGSRAVYGGLAVGVLMLPHNLVVREPLVL